MYVNNHFYALLCVCCFTQIQCMNCHSIFKYLDRYQTCFVHKSLLSAFSFEEICNCSNITISHEQLVVIKIWRMSHTSYRAFMFVCIYFWSNVLKIKWVITGCCTGRWLDCYCSEAAWSLWSPGLSWRPLYFASPVIGAAGLSKYMLFLSFPTPSACCLSLPSLTYKCSCFAPIVIFSHSINPFNDSQLTDCLSGCLANDLLINRCCDPM